MMERYSIIRNCILKISHQSVRFKGPKLRNRDNWKPIPPKSRRDEYFKESEYFDWKKPLLRYKKTADNKVAGDSTPHQMHVVTRCKHLKGQTKVHKHLCEHFGIFEKMHKPVIVANTPSNNELLMQIKHLIRIQPLKLPYGLPDKESELNSTQLRTDGTLDVIKTLNSISESNKETRLLKRSTLRENNQRKVDSYKILSEYFKTEYVWKYNEDGKEYPYKPIEGN